MKITGLAPPFVQRFYRETSGQEIREALKIALSSSVGSTEEDLVPFNQLHGSKNDRRWWDYQLLPYGSYGSLHHACATFSAFSRASALASVEEQSRIAVISTHMTLELPLYLSA
jgi:hypothetical protein